MKIELHEVSIRELTAGYQDNEEAGVVGFGGGLDIRPPYQREFIYKDKQRDAVINTVTRDFPLNVMYWSVRGDGHFEIIDGQQRTISICQYVAGDFSIDSLAFHNLPTDKREQILNYKVDIYQCTGTDSERLDWFRTINIAGEQLSDQELRNAVYAGPWVSDAKRYFAKNSRPKIGDDYLSGAAIRQDYLETAIAWVSDGDIDGYMSKHQHDKDATALWEYFQAVITWVKTFFTTYRKEMKGVPWGELYNGYKGKPLDGPKLEQEIAGLMEDDDVTNKRGIYSYVLTRKEKCLNIRAFTDKQKREAFERQHGVCFTCNKTFKIEEMEPDHITPWHEGGKTIAANCRMLCKGDNRAKAGK